MKKVKSIKFNWRQVGSTIDRDGAGEDWERVTVGTSGAVVINEHFSDNDTVPHSYTADFEDGSSIRIFNANFVEYFPVDEL